MDNFNAGQGQEQVPTPPTSEPPAGEPPAPGDAGVPQRPFWKFVLGFVLIIVVTLAIASLISYLSPGARRDRELERNVEQYERGMREFEEMMRADTYGGATPQETLDMFVDALKKGDVELASKYFSLNGPLSRGEWKTEIEERKEEIIGAVIRAVPTLGQEESETTFWFSVFDQQDEEIQQLIEMSFNSSAGVWKIESI